MGGPGSGRKKGSGGKSKSKKMIKIKTKRKVGYKVDDIGPGGKVVRSTGWKY